MPGVVLLLRLLRASGQAGTRGFLAGCWLVSNGY